MKTATGHVYQVTLAIPGLLAGADWVVVPLLARYPVSALAQSDARVTGDGAETDVTVRWDGAPGEIGVGDKLEAESMQTLPMQASATVARVTEVTGAPAASASSNALSIAAACAVLGFVVYGTLRVQRKSK